MMHHRKLAAGSLKGLTALKGPYYCIVRVSGGPGTGEVQPLRRFEVKWDLFNVLALSNFTLTLVAEFQVSCLRIQVAVSNRFAFLLL
mgnify:CR=1 FL=1